MLPDDPPMPRDATSPDRELDKPLDDLLLRVCEAFRAEAALILMLEPRSDELVARAGRGLDEVVEQGLRIPLGRGLAGRIAAERRPIVTGDPGEAGPLSSILRERGIASVVGIPLVVEDELIGVLVVGLADARDFTMQDIELVALAAQGVAWTVERARLYQSEREAHEQSEAAADRLRRIQGVMDVAMSHLSVDELLAELLSRIRDALDADTCAVLMLDEEANELVARAALGIEEEVERGVRMSVGHGFGGRVAAARAPVVLDDVDRADIVNPLLREKGIKSLLGVPLMVDGRVTGVLHVGTLRPRRFDAFDVELLQLVAERASLAIERARAFEVERRARERLERVQAITDAALEHLELNDLLAELLLRIKNVLHVDTCVVLLLDEVRAELVATAAIGLEEEVEQGIRVPLGRGFAGRVAAERHSIVLDDVRHADVVNPLLKEKNLATLLGMPLLVRGEAIGVLHVGSLTPRVFETDEVELLRLVADRVALAIEKARVHDETLKLDQLKLNFVAFASHELRTPAAAVYGILATLRERAGTLTEETRIELEETLWEQTERLRRLIEQLLDLSRLDSSAVDVRPRPIELGPFIRELVTANLNGSRGTVVVDVADERTVVADSLALERVLSNLLVNAHRYGQPPITVSVQVGGDKVCISVCDEGGGVPDELRPRLFERFERGVFDSRGAGLGLAIARAYAQAVGGELSYVPRKRGARFDFRFPLQLP